MVMSPQTRNFFDLVRIIDDTELPGGKRLQGNFNTDGDFCFRIAGQTNREAVIQAVENVSCSIHVSNMGDIEEMSIFPIPPRPADYQLKDIVRKIVVEYLLAI